ncbi:MAG: hypothetical protein D3924_14620 [Candidatus Electrothrix sp. AR4]|nr:hypothetical protein [Candidatus Electrothrix sp. AR4]
MGKIIQGIGPVVDVEFKAGELPEIMSALFVTNPVRYLRRYHGSAP